MDVNLKNTETLDDLLHGQLKLIQHRKGYRYSVDALLLAHFALPLVKNKVVLDMGSGTGVIALILARRGEPARVIGVEIQKKLIELAKRNAELNDTSPRVEIIHDDATQLTIEFDPGFFDVVVTNPPFFPTSGSRMSPNVEKALARHEVAMSLRTWLGEAAKLIHPDGSICMVYSVNHEQRLMKTVEKLKLHLARRLYALDRPGGARRLVLLDLRLKPRETQELDDVPIETEKGKWSLDGYR